MKFEGMINYHNTFNIVKYLGFPLLSSRVTNVNFSFIIDDTNSYLAGWKGRFLSRSKRANHAKYVLSFIHIYTMHNLWLQEDICSKIDSRIR